MGEKQKNKGRQRREEGKGVVTLRHQKEVPSAEHMPPASRMEFSG